MPDALRNFLGQFRWREDQLVYVEGNGMGRLAKRGLVNGTFFKPLCWVHGPTFSLWFSYTKLRPPRKEQTKNYLEIEDRWAR